jgi:hypothetical protein
MDFLDHTPYYPNEIQVVALMDDRYVSKLVFDVHYFAYFQYQYFGTLCSGMDFLHILLPNPQMS